MPEYNIIRARAERISECYCKSLIIHEQKTKGMIVLSVVVYLLQNSDDLHKFFRYARYVGLTFRAMAFYH